MNDNVTLGAIRRRWWIIVLFAIAGGVLGALPEPERVDEQERTFSATHTLLLNDTENQNVSVISPNQVTLFVTTGEVPARAAETIDFGGNPASLASRVTPFFDFTTGSLTITVTGTDGSDVERVADTFADELVLYLAERQDVIYQERLASQLDRLTTLEEELATVTRDLARDPDDPILIAQQSAISRQYSVAFEQSENLDASPPVIGFTTLQRAQAVETTDRGLTAPRSRTSRAILGFVVGAAIGFGIAVVLGLLDRRLRTKEQAEQAVDMRARVLIPKVRDKDRDGLLVTSDRHDQLSDAYRTVRNVVAFVQSDLDMDRAPITLVVSPSPGDGKTTLAANLAAASAEAGQRTVLVNADFRRPRLTSVFGPEAGEPLPFLLEDIDRLRAKALLGRTGVDRLRILDLASVPGSAGELVRASANKLDELARLSDAIIVDTSPVGATAEVLDLVPYADTIVMITRIGNSKGADAERAIGILRDLTTAPILFVLSGLKHDRDPYYEYNDRKPKSRRAERKARRKAEKEAAAEAAALEEARAAAAVRRAEREAADGDRPVPDSIATAADAGDRSVPDEAGDELDTPVNDDAADESEQSDDESPAFGFEEATLHDTAHDDTPLFTFADADRLESDPTADDTDPPATEDSPGDQTDDEPDAEQEFEPVE